MAAKRAYIIRGVAFEGDASAGVLRRAWRTVLVTTEYRAGPCGPPVFMVGLHDQAALR
jgi:hypothetical protein